jgi:hypothetical protein
MPSLLSHHPQVRQADSELGMDPGAFKGTEQRLCGNGRAKRYHCREQGRHEMDCNPASHSDAMHTRP